MLDGDFKDLAVVSVQQAENLGTVEDIQLDVKEHRVAALLLRGGLFRGGPMVPWSDVRSVGRDAIMVDTSTSAVARTDGDSLIRLDSLRNTQVVGDNGELAGTVVGADVDPESGQILAYIVAAPEGGGLFHQAPRFRVESTAIQAIGPKLVTINSSVVNFQSET
jgi:sporulation protein YlmC with PRC-barrel domain